MQKEVGSDFQGTHLLQFLASFPDGDSNQMIDPHAQNNI